LGITVNSGSDSEVKVAVKAADAFHLLVNRKETLEVLCKGELMTIVSSSFGSVASNVILNLLVTLII
jgi:hypothetical protein